MKIFIAGGTGFLGLALIRSLVAQGHQVTALARNPQKIALDLTGLRVLQGSPLKLGPWQQEVAAHDAVINLTGTSIFTRWSAKNKELILKSRTLSTRNLVEALPARPSRPQTLLNTSASGFYGFCGEEEIYEDAPAGSDFLATVCRTVEEEANRAQGKARVITMRVGIVLGKNGGALAKMLPGFRLGVAGKLGHGRQWFPWIHLNDLLAAILFCLENSTIEGPVNMSAPNPVRNEEFTRTLGTVLGRPTFLGVPAFLVRLVLGELSSVVLEGCRMKPGVLQKNGFAFRFPGLAEALREIVAKP